VILVGDVIAIPGASPVYIQEQSSQVAGFTPPEPEVRYITSGASGDGPGSLVNWKIAKLDTRDTVDPTRYNKTLKGELEFKAWAGRTVHYAVFAAKVSSVERAFILVVPPNHKAKNLLIVISHGFSQNEAWYEGTLHYSNPLSQSLIEWVTGAFALKRWGSQLFAAGNDTALLMPVRAKAGSGSSELGPFADQSGVGAKIVSKIWDHAFNWSVGPFNSDLDQVSVVTFSSGIFDTNNFISVGSKGLNIVCGYNQDPAKGLPLPTSITYRRQFLSGNTTGGNTLPGFEFLPIQKWAKERYYKSRVVDGQKFDNMNYMHTHCIPYYTLHLALTT
jgi:hypothetical protein